MTLAHVSEMPNHTRAERQGGRPQRGTSQTRPEQPAVGPNPLPARVTPGPRTRSRNAKTPGSKEGVL